MKILILTQPLGHNFGGILQAYALQKHLTKAGHEVETLDRGYTTTFFDKLDEFIFLRKYQKNNLARLNKFGKKIISKVTKLTSQQAPSKLSTPVVAIERSKPVLINFCNDHLTLSPRITTNRQLNKYSQEKHFDAYIVGSDQVWRPKYSPFISNFFLDFLGERSSSVKRLSYAASFGVDDWEYTSNETLICKKLAENFDAISVREQSAVELCEKYFNLKAEWVVDPTLLLDVADYTQLFTEYDRNRKEENYITAYVLDSNKENMLLATQVAQRLSKKIIFIEPYNTNEYNVAHMSERLTSPNISEWLRSFASCSFVITDSFHGTVFSIIFNKPFISIGNKGRGLARFHSLLSVFNLENRLILSSGDINQELLTKEIDWESVNLAKKDWVGRSKKFLEDRLKTSPL